MIYNNMHLLDIAPLNMGVTKKYASVVTNRVAFAKLSFQRGFLGNVAFISKTQLIEFCQMSLNPKLVTPSIFSHAN